MERFQSNRKIWVLEDEESSKFVYEQILGVRYKVRFFPDLESFKAALNKLPNPDLLIADLKLPDGNFVQFLGENEQIARVGFPFIVVSSLDDLDVLRICYRDGALDYITKPFSKNELIVKIERILSKSEPHQRFVDESNEIILDTTSLSVRRGGKILTQLTPKELQVFSCLEKFKGRTVRKKEIVNHVWGDVKVCPKTLDVHLFRLRRKIEAFGFVIRHIPPDGFSLLKKDPADTPPPPHPDMATSTTKGKWSDRPIAD